MNTTPPDITPAPDDVDPYEFRAEVAMLDASYGGRVALPFDLEEIWWFLSALQQAARDADELCKPDEAEAIREFARQKFQSVAAPPRYPTLYQVAEAGWE